MQLRGAVPAGGTAEPGAFGCRALALLPAQCPELPAVSLQELPIPWAFGGTVSGGASVPISRFHPCTAAASPRAGGGALPSFPLPGIVLS